MLCKNYLNTNCQWLLDAVTVFYQLQKYTYMYTFTTFSDAMYHLVNEICFLAQFIYDVYGYCPMVIFEVGFLTTQTT